jgi:hypothetical protein
MKGWDVRDNIILKTIREELIGPCAYGDKFNWKSGTIKKSEVNSPLTCDDDGEEILKVYPLKRYGMGVLYPLESITEIPDESDTSVDSKLLEQEQEGIEPPQLSIQVKTSNTGDSNDFDISLTNARLPSSMGVSFIFDDSICSNFEIKITGAFYLPFNTQDDEGHRYNWWKREPISLEIFLGIKSSIQRISEPLKIHTNDTRLSNFYIEGVIRKYGRKAVATIVLVNRTDLSLAGGNTYQGKNLYSLFQTQLFVRTINNEKEVIEAVLPYPSQPIDSFTDLSNDDRSNELVYQNAQSFGRGHGVAVDWNAKPYVNLNSVSQIFTEVMPTFETPSISAEVENKKEKLEISMEALSKIEPGSEGDIQLLKLIKWYNGWIDELIVQKENIKHSDEKIQKELMIQANKHIERCKKASDRITEGFKRIQNDQRVKLAFQLTNLAMLNQQKRAPKTIRKAHIIDDKIIFKTPFKPNISAKGVWRPFQIGFLLMCLSEAAESEHIERELVDLIWFPTGGGKTEAYLGLAAFTLLFNRMEYKDYSSGVQVLMRYTLRLLTAQQLQRAATLICCLEVIRRTHNIQGGTFSIGLWVGSKNTPNKRKDALSKFSRMKKAIREGGKIENPFLLDRCPYCGSQMGVAGKDGKFLSGYKKERASETIAFKCEDVSCDFSGGIPVVLIDEDIYEQKPSIVIGTVDKFAMLAWEPKIRNLFGIDSNGKRDLLPPQLIIQDELHLITGPLGTMVGHYEPLIEELCSYKSNNGNTVKPKIVCATATTNGYEDQVRAIYGREHTEIFPPPGLSADDSFFSKYEKDENDNLAPGRKYVGICAPGLGSVLTTQVRAHSAMLFSSNRVEFDKRDPWVTLLSFYNSIRELGGALTLFQADITSYLLELKRRYPRFLLPRYINGGMELTSRLQDDEIPAAITLLERGLKHEIFNANFYQSLLIELEEFLLIEPNSKIVSQPLIDELMTNKTLMLEAYVLVDNFNRLCKKEKWDIPKTISSLTKILQGRDVTPFCLASSIIEVGVDIDRLSLMSIVGQPKTTAQYIQVSGRVGRRPSERPGLVAIIYNNGKPRDKSHYEDFRSYHQRLYAQVEPSSVTPYSRPAIERGFAALMVAHARQFLPLTTKPKDVPKKHFEDWLDRLIDIRFCSMQKDELQDIKSYFHNRFIKSWTLRGQTSETWGHLKPETEPHETDYICPLGSSGRKTHQVECPTSMRNVDGESVVWISPRAYEIPEDDDVWEEFLGL